MVGVSSRSQRTLPGFGRRRGMLDAAYRRRWPVEHDQPVDDAARTGGAAMPPSPRLGREPDPSPEHAS
jgi:hypothetical protein